MRIEASQVIFCRSILHVTDFESDASCIHARKRKTFLTRSSIKTPWKVRKNLGCTTVYPIEGLKKEQTKK